MMKMNTIEKCQIKPTVVNEQRTSWFRFSKFIGSKTSVCATVFWKYIFYDHSVPIAIILEQEVGGLCQ